MERHERVQVGVSRRRSFSRRISMLAIPVALALIAAPLAHAEDATTLSLSIKGHHFTPAELTAKIAEVLAGRD